MSQVLWHDGFGQYADAAELSTRQGVTECDINNTLQSGPRAGAKEIIGGSASGNGFYVGVNPATTTQGIIGSLVHVISLANAGTNRSHIHEISESDATVHLCSRANVDGSISVLRGTGSGTVLGTSAAAVISAGNRYFIETKFTIDNSAGAIEVRVNNAVVVTVTAQDTRNGGTSGTWSLVQIGVRCHSTGATILSQTDVYIADATGGHDYIGESQTDYHVPDTNGAVRDWTRSTGSDDYSLVDEGATNSDTDYVHATDVGDIVTFGVEALKESGSSIIAVTPLLSAKKVEAGTGVITPVIRHDGVNYTGDDLSPSTSAYRWVAGVPEMTNPGTAADWTEAGFNAAEFGVEKVG